MFAQGCLCDWTKHFRVGKINATFCEFRVQVLLMTIDVKYNKTDRYFAIRTQISSCVKPRNVNCYFGQ